MTSLSNILVPSSRSRESLVLIQSTLSTPWLPLFHAIISGSSNANTCTVICVCILHPPESVIPASVREIGSEGSSQRVKIVDWTTCVPDYDCIEKQEEALQSRVISAIEESNGGPVILVVDSPDTLCADMESPSRTYTILKSWHNAISKHPAPSRMIIHLPSRSPLLPLVITPSFAPSLTHLNLHPPALLRHLASDYLTLPPQHSPPAKFWPIFSGLSTRGEAEKLVWGPDGEGWCEETVVEVLSRSVSGKKTVDRNLEGWRPAGSCTLEELESLKGIWGKRVGESVNQQQASVDPTRDLSFNLSLTEAQQQSRAQVPLPYAHEGQIPNAGAIFYDPDSADDIDEDDPDEDLDI